MNKLDHLMKSIDRLVELKEEILREIRVWGLTELTVSRKPAKPKMDKEDLDNLMDSSQVRSKLKISESTLTRNVQKGLITPIRIGRRNRYDLTQIESLKNYFMK